ncbi:hypothetical protein [Schlesneria paludicola]|uniref:hypothetical protein n=1 Tax=Schlesneria paludicola TaxID=360056 RepID=UPI00029A419A|nr:hypothetical protein [Schlesneria paludicola]
MFRVFKRAFTSNLQTVAPTASEQTSLEAAGIRNPVLQAYMAWRSSLMIVVVISTILSAGLSTYREVFEEDDQPDVFETLVAQFSKQASSTLPAATKLIDGIDQRPESDAISNDASPDESENEDAVKDLAKKPKSAFSQFDEMIHLAALYVLPIAALIVIATWTQFRFTYRILVCAFAFSFLTPILLSFCPWSWWDGPSDSADLLSPLAKSERFKDGLIEALTYLSMLLPTVLSLLPGVQKACVRVKTLLPQATLPGWFLVAAAPFYGLFLLVIFVAVNQVFSHPMVLAGMLLILSASLIYGFRASVFTRPLVTDADYRQMYTVQRTAGMMTLVAGGLFFAYLQTHDILGIYLLGLDPKTSLLQPLDLVEFFLEITGRSMFMTVFGADLFMQINLSAWKSTRQFVGSAAADEYDAIMSATADAA